MKKVGIKILSTMNYEAFESFQYLLHYDFEYDDLVEHIESQKLIELDIDDDDKEDREEDIEVLQAFLATFDKNNLEYELYSFDETWNTLTVNELS